MSLKFRETVNVSESEDTVTALKTDEYIEFKSSDPMFYTEPADILFVDSNNRDMVKLEFKDGKGKLIVSDRMETDEVAKEFIKAVNTLLYKCKYVCEGIE